MMRRREPAMALEARPGILLQVAGSLIAWLIVLGLIEWASQVALTWWDTPISPGARVLAAGLAFGILLGRLLRLVRQE